MGCSDVTSVPEWAESPDASEVIYPPVDQQQPANRWPVAARRRLGRYPDTVAEKLPRSVTAAVKAMAELALLRERVAMAREEASAELNEGGLSPEQISSVYKDQLLARGDLTEEHLKGLGVSRSTVANEIGRHRARQGKD